MQTEYISNNTEAPVIVLFGGNPLRREEVIKQLKQIGDISIYGTLSEEEGLAKIKSLTKVDLVLIGGRYADEQRIKIRKFVAEHLPSAKISEPGVYFPYETQAINNDVMFKIGLQIHK